MKLFITKKPYFSLIFVCFFTFLSACDEQGNSLFGENNTPPELSPIADITISTGSTIDLDILVTDKNPDDELTIALTLSPEFVNFSKTTKGRGVISIQPDESHNGNEYPVKLLAYDGQTASEETFIISVISPEDCSTKKTLFMNKVWPVLNTQCLFCHQENGKTTNFNLVDGSVNRFNDKNFNAFELFSKRQNTNEQASILSKPTNILSNHAGGTIFSTTSTEYLAFTTMLEKLERCDGKENVAPTWQTTSKKILLEDKELVLTVIATDENKSQTLTLQALNLPVFMTFTDNGNGNGLLSLKPKVGDFGEYNITLVAHDGQTSTDLLIPVSILNKKINHPPTFSSIENITVLVGSTSNIDILISDKNPEDNLTLELISPPNFISLTKISNTQNKITMTPSNLHSDKQYSVKLLASDGQADTELEFVVSVSSAELCSANEPEFLSHIWPILKTQCYSCHGEDHDASNFHLIKEDVIGFNKENFNLFKTAAKKVDTNNLSLILSKATNGLSNHAGGTRFSNNSNEYSVFESMVEKVSNCKETGENIPPVWDVIPPQSLIEGEKLSLTVTASDENKTQTISLQAENLPSFISFTDNNNGFGLLQINPEENDSGKYNITLLAYDGQTTSEVIVPVSIIDNKINNAPYITAITYLTVTTNESSTIDIISSDEDLEDIVTLSLTSSPEFVSFEEGPAGKGVIKVNPNATHADQEFSIIIEASDGKTQTTHEITLSVANAKNCNSYENLFLTDVWPLLNNLCIDCHNAGSLSLVDENTANFNTLNFNTFKNLSVKRDNENLSILLTKPSNIHSDHGGGKRFDKNSENYQTFELMIKKMDSCIVEKVSNKLIHLAPYQRLRKTTLALASRLPTAEEEQSIANANQSETSLENAINAVADQLMTENNFYIRLKEIFNDLLLLDAYPKTTALSAFDLSRTSDKEYFRPSRLKNEGYSNNETSLIRRNLAYGLAQAPLELIAHVVKNNRPFTEILTADYLLVNPYSATQLDANVNNDASFNFKYGDTISQHDQNDFRETKLQVKVDGELVSYPHAGILNTQTYLTRYPTTATNHNRARASKTFLYFLDTDIEGLSSRNGLNLDELVGEYPSFEDPQCRTCHDIMDPLSSLFKNWNRKGLFQGDVDNWFSEKNPQQIHFPGFTLAIEDQLPPEKSNSALQWLSNRITKDPRFAFSTVKTVFTGLTGQEAPKDTLYLETLKNEFNNDFNLKTLIKRIINGIYFTSDNASIDNETGDFSDVGMGRLLTPKQLHRKIIAVTDGYEWRSPSKRKLSDIDSYRLLYGGINSKDVTVRTKNPTAIIAAVQKRIALQASCNSVVLDFKKGIDNRAFFPLVEITDTPESIVGENKIKKNIQHLYKQLLGETLDINAPDINQTYELFLAVRNAILSSGEIPYDCSNGLDNDQPVKKDNDRTVRPWMAVVAKMMYDYRFFYE